MNLMAVYEGVLHGISGGNVISSVGTRITAIQHRNRTTVRHSGVDWQAGFTHREFVDIGDTRIKNLMLMPYYDELLQEAIGSEVALSMIGPPPSSDKRHTVVAMRTPKGGLNRPSRTQLVRGSMKFVFRYSIAGLVIGGILAFIGARIAGDPGALLGAAFVILWEVSLFRSLRKTFRAAAAL
jgi:hypothetical protein